jgi:ATP-dependent RNA helicase SUPV3L1/SUV3
MDVLVASDAVGMGLNLNIRRVVFTTLTKPASAGARAPMPVPSIQQIAGRAGRRSSAWNKGLAAVLDPADAPALAAALAAPTADDGVPRAGLSPEFEQLEAYAGRHVDASFAALLSSLADDARLSGRYFFASQAATLDAARAIAHIPGLSLRDRHLFCQAPANLRVARQRDALVGFADAFGRGGPVTLAVGAARADKDRRALRRAVTTSRLGSPPDIRAIEDEHAVVSLWLWLANRFGDSGAFVGRAEVEAAAAALVASLDAHLEAVSAAAAASGRAAARKARADEKEGDAKPKRRSRAKKESAPAAAAADGGAPPTAAAPAAA